MTTTSDGGESFLRRFTINEDLMKKNVTIEVHLASTDLLLTVQVDSRNRIKSFSTTYLPGKTDANGVSTSFVISDYLNHSYFSGVILVTANIH